MNAREDEEPGDDRHVQEGRGDDQVGQEGEEAVEEEHPAGGLLAPGVPVGLNQEIAGDVREDEKHEERTVDIYSLYGSGHRSPPYRRKVPRSPAQPVTAPDPNVDSKIPIMPVTARSASVTSA